MRTREQSRLAVKLAAKTRSQMRRIYHSSSSCSTPSLQEQSKTQLRNDAQMPPLFRQGYQIQYKKEMVCNRGPKAATPTDEAARTQKNKGWTICKCYRETPGIQNMTAINERLLLGRLRLEPAHRSKRSVNRVPEDVWLCMY